MKRAFGWVLYALGWVWLAGSVVLAANRTVDPDTRMDYVLGGLCGGGLFIGAGFSLLLAARRARHEAALRAWTAAQPAKAADHPSPER
jgi:hypothetical protein